MDSILLQWTEYLAYPYYETVDDLEMFRSGWLYNIILMRITDKIVEDEVLALRKQTSLVNIEKAIIIAKVLTLPVPFRKEDISTVRIQKLEAFLLILYSYHKTNRCLTSDEIALTEAEQTKKRNIQKAEQRQLGRTQPAGRTCNLQ
ncbi:hypothetical protein LOD99_13044 [Oopsacas minuta]|uniref:Uncharacterized protein n=1 Tax=Oopsacas minuta TaxID=111878 RepID=A0AAV7JAP1_9METZ|nr:hypothetical protein LOD99_13044 [Oopsacas minuta]